MFWDIQRTNTVTTSEGPHSPASGGASSVTVWSPLAVLPSHRRVDTLDRLRHLSPCRAEVSTVYGVTARCYFLLVAAFYAFPVCHGGQSIEKLLV